MCVCVCVSVFMGSKQSYFSDEHTQTNRQREDFTGYYDPEGHFFCRLWFLQPLKNVEKLRERHDAIAFFVDQCHMEVTSSLQKCLREIKDTKVVSKSTRSILRASYLTVYKYNCCVYHLFCNTYADYSGQNDIGPS